VVWFGTPDVRLEDSLNAKLSLDLRQGNRTLPALGPLCPTELQQVFRIRQALLHCEEFLVGKHRELLLPVLNQDFRVQYQHILVCSSIRFSPMPPTIHYHPGVLHFKQHAVVAHPEPVLRREPGQLLHVASQIVLQCFDSGDDPVALGCRQLFQVL